MTEEAGSLSRNKYIRPRRVLFAIARFIFQCRSFTFMYISIYLHIYHSNASSRVFIKFRTYYLRTFVRMQFYDTSVLHKYLHFLFDYLSILICLIRRFNLYLKLFIVMGINWSMEIISWFCNNSPAYIWYLTDLTNTLQGVIIFFIFVWKDKVKRLLLKRFGCHKSNVLSRNSTRSAYLSSAASRTCTSTTPFQEKIISYSNEPSCTKATVDN